MQVCQSSNFVYAFKYLAWTADRDFEFNQRWYKHQSHSSMAVSKVRFCLPGGAEPCIDFTEVAEGKQKSNTEGAEDILKNKLQPHPEWKHCCLIAN